MTGVGALDSVDGEGADSVDGKLIDVIEFQSHCASRVLVSSTEA
jgi:hypothetical protein